MMPTRPARPTPHVLYPMLQRTKNNSITHRIRRAGQAPQKGCLPTLLETLEVAGVPSNKSLRQYQQEES